LLLPKIQKPVKYGVILADPPWQFDIWSDHTVATSRNGPARKAMAASWEPTGRYKPDRLNSRSADGYYSVQDTKWIASLPVASIAADDCALFLWAIWPMLPEAMATIKSWGFEYKTVGFCWVKCCKNGNPGFGMGYWTRGNSEPCLLATRGNPKRLDKGVPQAIVSEFEPDDLLVAPRTKHSEKPAESHRRIERLVAGPYLELFGRKKVEGWTVIGDEITGRDIVDDIRLLS
jgi:N6-adenosine-specific RNA methylase IME4